MILSAVPRLAAREIARDIDLLGRPLDRVEAHEIAQVLRHLRGRTTLGYCERTSDESRLRKVGGIRLPPLVSPATAIMACSGATLSPCPKAIVMVLSSAPVLGHERFGVFPAAPCGAGRAGPSCAGTLCGPRPPTDHGHAGRADVGGILEHLRHGQHLMLGVEIVDGEAAVAQVLAGIHPGVQRDLVGPPAPWRWRLALKVDPHLVHPPPSGG